MNVLWINILFTPASPRGWSSYSFWKPKVQHVCPRRWTPPNLLHNPTTGVEPIPFVAMWFAKIWFGVWQVWWLSVGGCIVKERLNVHEQVFATYNRFYTLAHQVQAIPFFPALMSSSHLITLHISFLVDCSHHGLYNWYWSLRVLSS